MKIMQVVISVWFSVVFLSGYAHAGASEDFKTSCKKTTASITESIYLTKYTADANSKHKGIFITDSSGTSSFIPGAEYYPDNYVATELRKTALAAVISGIKVNICAKKRQNSLAEVWAIELDTQ
ncbi:TPA: Heat-labile enterotoxin IIA, B chain [Escherichia coli]|nr:Heat-labile enterotoxin IIA, B chain [Escherichia coli]HAW0565567.1 Heat-labile enterotoxin IIA, B chain [Escherichia coli]